MRSRILFILVVALSTGLGCQMSGDLDGVRYDTQPADDVASRKDVGGADDDTAARADTPADAADVAAMVGDCRPSSLDPASIALPEGAFADPVAILLTDDYVFVANTNVGVDGTPGQGFVTVLDRVEQRVLNRIATSAPFPAALALAGDELVVVERGLVAYDDTAGASNPEGSAGLELVALADVATAKVFDRMLPLAPRGVIGAPWSIEVAADGETAWLGSGTAGAIFEVDLAGCTVERGSDDPIAFDPSVVPGRVTVRLEGTGRVWAADFMTGLVHVLDLGSGDLDAATNAPYDLGDTAAPADLLIRNGPGATDALVLLAGDDRVARVAVTTGDLVTNYQTTAADPTAFALTGDVLYVTSTTDHVLQRFDLATGARTPAFVAFGEGVAPSALAIDAAGELAWVVDAGTDTIAIVDLAAAAVTEVIGGTTLPTCIAPPAPTGTLPEASFASPQGILAAGDYVFVANGNWSVGADFTVTYGQGFVTVLDPLSRTVVNRIPTTQPNPQFLATDGTKLYVVNTGPTAFDATDNRMEGTGSGGIDVLDLATVATATQASANVELPVSGADQRIGAPGAIRVTDGGVAYVGSGTGPFLFAVDLATCEVLRGVDDPIVVADSTEPELVTPVAGPNGLVAVLLQSADRVRLLDPDGDVLDPAPWAGLPWDVHPATDAVGGPIDAAYREGGNPDLFVLLTLDPAVTTIATATGTIVPKYATAGLYPNRIRLLGDYLYVVNSGADAVQRIAPDTADSIPAFMTVATGSNPYDLTFATLPTGDVHAYVANLMTHSVTVFDAADGSELDSLP